MDTAKKQRIMSNDNNVVKCPGSLTIAAVSGLHGELKTALETQQEIVLNGADVEVADTAALQLLCALFMDATTQDISIRWEGASKSLHASAKQIGVDEIIGLGDTSIH